MDKVNQMYEKIILVGSRIDNRNYYLRLFRLSTPSPYNYAHNYNSDYNGNQTENWNKRYRAIKRSQKEYGHYIWSDNGWLRFSCGSSNWDTSYKVFGTCPVPVRIVWKAPNSYEEGQ